MRDTCDAIDVRVEEPPSGRAHPGLRGLGIRAGLALVLLASGSVWAAPALAAEKAVSVLDNAFVAPQVGVATGDTVTWIASASALNAHNVKFEDGGLIDPSIPVPGPWTTSRTFGTAGVYPYYCQIHGTPGGLGMAGVVYVNAAANIPPVATLDVTPVVPQPGQSVSFSATRSSDVDGTLSQYDWDLDGDGSFETNTGTAPITSRSYATAGQRTVKLRVTDNGGDTHETSRLLRVNSQPTASFTISPNPALPGTVRFDGSASSDSDGSVARYQWDLDGDGAFETDTADTPNVSRAYQTPGTKTIGLRVTDNEGGTGQTQRSLEVTAGPPVTVTPKATSSPPPPRFEASSRSIAVKENGRFSYTFGATAGTKGSMTMRSAAKVNLSERGFIGLGTRSFTVGSSGVAKVEWKLSRRNLRVLKRKKRIRFRATVTLRNAAGAAASGTTTLTLRRPR